MVFIAQSQSQPNRFSCELCDLLSSNLQVPYTALEPYRRLLWVIDPRAATLLFGVMKGWGHEIN
jgi:hypothetical protein